MKTQKVIIGKFGSVYGVQGWIRIYSFTEPKENLLNYKPLYIFHQQQWQSIAIDQIKTHDDHFIAKLQNCDDRDLAKQYTNNLIGIDRSNLPALADQEYYWSDLIGLKVITTEGIELGHVKQMLGTGNNDVFVVENGKRHLIPYTDDVIEAISLTDNLITVTWDPEF